MKRVAHVALGLIGLGLVLCALVSCGKGEVSGESLVVEADRFVAPASWSLVEDELREGPICIDVECPSVYRRWELGSAPTADEVTENMEAAGWSNIDITRDCQPRPNRTGAALLCEATADAHGLKVTIRVNGTGVGPDQPTTATMILLP